MIFLLAPWDCFAQQNNQKLELHIQRTFKIDEREANKGDEKQ